MSLVRQGLGLRMEKLPSKAQPEQSNSASADFSQYVRADFQSSITDKQFVPLFSKNVNASKDGSDLQKTPQEENSLKTDSGVWRAPYGPSAAPYLKAVPPQTPGQEDSLGEAQVKPVWRNIYGVDAPIIVQPIQQNPAHPPLERRPPAAVDPATGQPLKRIENKVQSNQSSNLETQEISTKNLDTNAQLNAELRRKRVLVDQSLEYNTVGTTGNIVSGAVGGVIGARAVPWVMDRISDRVRLNPDLQPQSTTQRIARFWQDNFDSRTWNRKELELMRESEGAARSAVPTASELTKLGRAKAYASGYAPAIAKGAGVAGSMMVVDHYADKFLFGKNHQNGIGDSINSALVPAALLIGPKTSVWKMGAIGAGALLAGKLIGSSVQEGKYPSYSRVFRQSTSESLLLAAEALLPFKQIAPSGVGKFVNWKQAALIGGTWLAFRGANLLFDAKPPSETKNKAWELLAEDAKERTGSSMTAAIDKFRALGQGNESHGILEWTNIFKQGAVGGHRGEAALEVYRAEWLTNPSSQYKSMIEAYRGATILCTAFAESRLEHGTHVPTIQDKPTYILADKNLDLGGKAAANFAVARAYLEGTKKQVQDNAGKEVAGKKVSNDEVASLSAVEKRINEDEAKIYGKHDMTAAIKELADWGKGFNEVHIAKLEVELRNTIASNKDSTDSRYKAKLYRDLATIYLAKAYAMKERDPNSAQRMLKGNTNAGRNALDITGQRRGFDGAYDCLKSARALHPDNADITELETFAAEVSRGLPGSSA